MVAEKPSGTFRSAFGDELVLLSVVLGLLQLTKAETAPMQKIESLFMVRIGVIDASKAIKNAQFTQFNKRYTM